MVRCGTLNSQPLIWFVQSSFTIHMSIVQVSIHKKENVVSMEISKLCNFKYIQPHNSLVSQEVLEELGVYLLLFDRAGYGESDPNPKRSMKSEASDIQELADHLQLGTKFYVIGVSVGAYPTWSCLKRIPHRQKENSLQILAWLLSQC